MIARTHRRISRIRNRIAHVAPIIAGLLALNAVAALVLFFNS